MSRLFLSLKVTAQIKLNSFLRFYKANVAVKYSIIFPIILRYVKQVSRFLAKGSMAKMEGKLHSTRSEIDGRFVNFFLNKTIVNEKYLTFLEIGFLLLFFLGTFCVSLLLSLY